MIRKISKIKKNIIIVTLFITSILCNSIICQIPVTAEEIFSQDVTLTENITAAAKILESEMNSYYNNVKTQIQDDCTKLNLDYELTMQSFYDQESPYLNYDYEGFIMLYLALKDYCLEENLAFPCNLNEIEYFDYQLDIQTITEVIPQEIDIYEKDEHDNYIKIGRKYITTNQTIPEYILVDEANELYAKTENSYDLTLKEREIKYGEVSFQTKSINDIIIEKNIPLDEIASYIQEKEDKYNTITEKAILNENVFINTPKEINSNQIEIMDKGIANAPTAKAKIVLTVAKSLLGSVPYEWGGKSLYGGFDKNWWTFQENGKQKGLDCSGYVQWVFLTSGCSEELCNSCYSTGAVLRDTEQYILIDQSSLLPGDIGLIKNNTNGTNHIGIYVGNGYWIHCSSEAGTVIVSSNTGFKYFYRVKEINSSINNTIPANEYVNEEVKGSHFEDNIESNIQDTIDLIEASNTKCDYSEEDLYYLTRTVQSEAGIEGYNGWIAVAEVIINRKNSTAFPDTIKDVCIQKGQFNGWWSRGKYYTEDELYPELVSACRSALTGQVKMFNNDSVLFFQNPAVTKSNYETFNGATKFAVVGNHYFYSKNL